MRKSYKYLETHKDNCYKAVEQLHKYSYLTPKNYTVLKDYTDTLEYMGTTLKFAIENECTTDIKKTTAKLEDVQSELKWLQENAIIYRDTRISLLEMHFKVEHIWHMDNSGYSSNPFFDFKELVEMINCWWDISEPYKPSNKIAFGWKFCLDKDKSCFYKGCKLYLWGCIKNYLIRNGIEFNKDVSLEIRKIVGLADCQDGDA